MNRRDDRLVTNFRRLPTTVRIVQAGESGDTNKVMTGQEAATLAERSGLDLVLIDDSRRPETFRLCQYDKFIYDEKKRQKEQERSQRAHSRTLKEMWFNQNVGPNDYQRMLTHVREWLPQHNVRIGVKLNGTNRRSLPRGMSAQDAHRWDGFVLNRVMRDLGDSVRFSRIDVGERAISTTVQPA